jgi:hypothetical protein
MAATDFFRDIGRTWWQKLEPKIYDLLCDTENEDREQFMKSLMEGAKSLALALAPALVAQLETLPSVASILATIAAKRIADAGLEAMCQKWGKSLDKRAEKAGEEGQPEAAEEELAEAGLAGAGGGGPDQAELYDEAGEQLPVGEQRPAGEEEEGPSQVDLYDRGD